MKMGYFIYQGFLERESLISIFIIKETKMISNKRYEELLEYLTRTDLLAIERTELANKRTLLAYIRTAFSLFLASLGIIEFFENQYLIYLGFIFIPVAIMFLIIGIIRFKQSESKIDRIIEYEKEKESN
jgi:putative membrane protein